MLLAVQTLLMVIYVLMPPGMMWWALAGRQRHGRAGAVASLSLAVVFGVVAGAGLVVLNLHLLGGRMRLWEGLQLIYLAIGAACLLRMVDRVMLRGAFRLSGVKFDTRGRPASGNRWAALLTLLVQRVVILGLSIPLVLALLLVYRPKVVLEGDPRKQLQRDFALAQFVSVDGIKLTGWWIPAGTMPPALEADVAGQWGRRSVVLCHGVGSGKEHLLSLAGVVSSGGFNVLVFDFRGHGESQGHWISYGDLERRDVLAAVRWAKANHAREAQRVFGIGINTGAAAVLAAAVDEAEGRNLDGVVLYEPFARFGTLADATARRILPQPLAWMGRHVAVPLASLHAGSDLNAFAPIDMVDDLWPRPLLLVHGRGETFVPVWEEMDLYQRATHPREQYWPTENYAASRRRLFQAQTESAILVEMFRQWLGMTDNIAEDRAVQDLTVRFLREAQSAPVL
jgi:fermentation-respiration switch protein FrsA (DUF1100 family)